MKIEKIEIENFRGVLNAELEFDAQLNVFIGGNGAGKTTVLMTIAQSLFQLTKKFTSKIQNVNSKYFEISNDDINYGQNYVQTSTFLKVNNFEDIVPIVINNGNVPTKVKNENSINSKKYSNFINFFNKQINSNTFTVPILKFYPSNRNVHLSGQYSGNFIYKIPQLETWSNIYQANVSYAKFFKWFFDYETKELRFKRDQNDINAEIPELKYVREAVQKAFKILQNKDYFLKSDQVKRNGNNNLIPTLILEDKATKASEDLNNKSDGEKAIITLIADIAYNLAIAKDFSEGDNYLSSPGIVLIDEIEAHLHPNWQREIIPLLTELFPNIQFFITTHSPQILAAVESQHVFICEDFKFSKINIKSKGLDSNTLLKHIFNSTERPKKYVDLVEKFDQIIEKEGTIEDLEAIISTIRELDSQDRGQDIDLLVTDLNLQLEAYKFDLAHETHNGKYIHPYPGLSEYMNAKFC